MVIHSIVYPVVDYGMGMVRVSCIPQSVYSPPAKTRKKIKKIAELMICQTSCKNDNPKQTANLIRVTINLILTHTRDTLLEIDE